MIADLKPYPAMKDSGVPWLGTVPERWRIERPKSSRAIATSIQLSATHRALRGAEHVESCTGRVKQAGADVVFDSTWTSGLGSTMSSSACVDHTSPRSLDRWAMACAYWISLYFVRTSPK